MLSVEHFLLWKDLVGQLGLGLDQGKVLGKVLHRMLLVVKLIVHQRVVIATDASKETGITSHGRPPAGLVDSFRLVASHSSVPFSCFEHLLLPDGGSLLEGGG